MSSPASGHQTDISSLSSSLGIPLNGELYELALTHRSYAYENGGIAHNERLEFLGDSVLNLAVASLLYERLAQLPLRLQPQAQRLGAPRDAGRQLGQQAQGARPVAVVQRPFGGQQLRAFVGHAGQARAARLAGSLGDGDDLGGGNTSFG